MIRATFLTLIVCAIATAQPAPRGWKPSFERLSRCVAQLPPAMRSPLEPVLADLNTGLSGGFLRSAQEKPVMPGTYIDSIERSAQICEYARARMGLMNVRPLLADLQRDLEIKVQDCRDNGWYRNVPVEVNTVKDGKPSPGWEIYYTWIPGKSLPSLQRVRFKALSPATESLPPGLYEFQAKKKDVESGEARVAVVSKGAVTCEIPVP